MIEWSLVRIPLAPLGNFDNFLYPTFSAYFGRDTKKRSLPSIRCLCQGTLTITHRGLMGNLLCTA